MAIGEFQPIDLLGMQGGLGNLPTAANVQALGNQQAAAAAGIEGLQARAMDERAQAQAAQQEQIDAQRFQTDLATFGDGSPKSIVTMMQRNPKYAKLLSDAHALEKADIQEADTLLLNGIYSRAANGDFAGAAAQARRRLEAEKAAGNDTTDEQAMVDQLESGDPALQQRAMRVIGGDLAGRVGLEKFASVYGGVTTADGNLVNRGTGDVTYQGQPKPAGERRQLVQEVDADGLPTNRWVSVDVNTGTQGTAPAVADNGGDVVDSIMVAENNTGNPNAKNPDSSASGPGQFIDSTWIDTFKRAYPNATLPDDAILALKNNPTVAKKMTAVLAQSNAKALSSAGLPVTPGTLYLSHFAGPAGAASILRALPSTPVENVLGADAIAANPRVLKGKTAGDVVAWANNLMTGNGMAAAGAATPSQTRLNKRLGAPPSGYKWNADGTQTYIKGGPEDPAIKARNLKTIPPTAVTGIQGNIEAMRKVNEALMELSKNTDAVGLKAYTPDVVLQRTDPNGIAARRAIGEIGATKIHDLSGAAVSASESPRFQPFVPKASDSPRAILEKLKGFKAELRAQLDEQNNFYGPDNGFRPYRAAPNPKQAGGWSYGGEVPK